MPDTFHTTSPDWTWFIIPYFFIGGIAGGSLFLAALLRLFGRSVDRPIAWLGAYVALAGALLSGLLLVVDLHRPERFWHMLVQSETLRPMLKWWSPMSFGSWGVLLFGLFAVLAAVGALYESGRVRWRPLGALSGNVLGAMVAIGGAIFGLFLAGYTGVLLSVSNRPIWADSAWLGMLFLFSGGSSAAATLILIAIWRRMAHPASLQYLASFDTTSLLLELVALVIFLASLGAAARVFLSWWGVLLVLGVVGLGILLPLAIGFGWVWRGRERGREHALVPAASLVLVGGLLLRVVVLLASHGVTVAGTRIVAP